MNKFIFQLIAFILIGAMNPITAQRDLCEWENIYFVDYLYCDYNPWVLVYSDEFSATSIDRDFWNTRFGSIHSDETFYIYYTDGDNYTFTNDCLNFIMKQEQITARVIPYENDSFILDDGGYNLRTFNYTSGMLESKYKFLYGIFEIHCKMPVTFGFYPTFWTFGSVGSFPNEDSYEIDVFELYDNNDSRLNMDVHYWPSPHGTPALGCHSHYDGIDITNLNTYSVLWDNHKLRWYYFDQTRDALKRTDTRFYTGSLAQEMGCPVSPGNYLRNLLYPIYPQNVIAGFVAEDDPALRPPSPLPNSYTIDYIRVYQQKEGGNKTINSYDIADSKLFNSIYGDEIVMDGDIIIDTTESLTIIATDEIVLKPGFTAMAGSLVTSRIDNTSRSNLNNQPSSFYYNQSIKHTHNNITNEIEQDNATISNEPIVIPNPNNGIFEIYNSNEKLFSEILIVNGFGEKVYFKNHINKGKNHIDISQCGPGIYFLHMSGLNNNLNAKIIVY